MKRIVWMAVTAQIFGVLALLAAVLGNETEDVLALGILSITSAILALREEK